jgi:hypothetical protein
MVQTSFRSLIAGRSYFEFGRRFLTGPVCCSNVEQQVATPSKPWELAVAAAGVCRHWRQWRPFSTVAAQVIAGLCPNVPNVRLGASGQQTGSNRQP